MSKRFLSPISLANLPSDPDGSEGGIYYNSIDKTIKFYNGTSWISLADAGSTSKYLVDHTHGVEGTVEEIIPSNTYNVDEIIVSMNSPVIQQAPVLVIDGGSPSDFPVDPNSTEYTLLDGGTP